MTIGKWAGIIAVGLGTGGGLGLYFGSSLLAPTVTSLGIGGADYTVTHPAETQQTFQETFDALPKIADGFTRIYRGTGSPNVQQVGNAFRANPTQAPNGAEVFATEAEATLHAGSEHPELVSATTNISTALGYPTSSSGSVIVYDVPNAIAQRTFFNNLINPAQSELFFKGSIPDAFRIATIPK
jgi:hypothetical protein